MSEWDIKVINAADIDHQKWSKMLSMTPELIAQYNEHWFLSAISEQWEAYVYGDYQAAFPCVYKKKYGVNVMYQPFFSREVSLLGNQDPELLKEVLSLIERRFSVITFNSKLSIQNFEFKATPMKYQVLNLHPTYDKIFENYTTNAKRILKKKSDVIIIEHSKTEDFIDLFREKVGSRLGYRTSNYNCLNELINQGLENETFKLYSLTKENNIQGYACFYFYRNVINYVKGALTDEGKQNGAMYAMFDHIIKSNSQSDKVLDFGGSNIEGVASFYKKFGANDNVYYSYEKNQLPFLLRKIYHFRQMF